MTEILSQFEKNQNEEEFRLIDQEDGFYNLTKTNIPKMGNKFKIDFKSLPDEILMEVFSFLKCEELFRVAQVCQRFNCLSKEENLWINQWTNLVKVDKKIIPLNRDHRRTLSSYCKGKHSANSLTPSSWRTIQNSPPNDSQYCENSVTFQVSLLGNANSGKTSFMTRRMNGAFTGNVDLNGAVEASVTAVDVYGTSVNLKIWDPLRNSIRQSQREYAWSWYRMADAVLIFFDLTSHNSFSDVKYWLKGAEEYADKSAIKVLVGCKLDLIQSRVVSFDEAKSFAKSKGVYYVETSSKDDINIGEICAALAFKLLEQERNGDRETIKLRKVPSFGNLTPMSLMGNQKGSEPIKIMMLLCIVMACVYIALL